MTVAAVSVRPSEESLHYPEPRPGQRALLYLLRTRRSLGFVSLAADFADGRPEHFPLHTSIHDVHKRRIGIYSRARHTCFN